MKKISIVFLVISLSANIGNVNAQLTLDDVHQKQMAMTNLLSMPLAFTENWGQFEDKTLFMAKTGGATFYFCNNEVAYLFVRDTKELIEDDALGRPGLTGMRDEMNRPRYKKESMLIKAQFIGANPNPEVIGADRLPHNNNYLLGNNPSIWRTDMPNYSAIIYKEIYPGIDLKYYGNGNSIKYDFIVNPGADVSQIRIHYVGVNNLSVTPVGDLQAQTRFGLINEKAPYIYQEIGGARLKVTGRYESIESGVFGFAVDDGFNPRYPLIIDPELVYSTYLGGINDDRGWGIAVDGSGNAYVIGRTGSTDFPTVNPYDDSLNGGWDVFVTKLSAGGDSLVYSTYLGGSIDDSGYNIAVDDSGNAYVTGYTRSSDFPTVNPYDDSLNGGWDVFVTKLSAAGNSLVYSTYLGGSGEDQGRGIAVDGSGNAYVTGYTGSSDFPTANAYDGSHNGDRDVFGAKLSASGDSLMYSTYLGGSLGDYGYGITVDADDNAYITGPTLSSNFPMVNSYDDSCGGVSDAFVAKLSPSTGGINSLIYSTYLGGNVDEEGSGIAVDAGGNVYVTGITASSDFPMSNPYDSTHNDGYYDVFVSKLSFSGGLLLYSTYLGGNEMDFGYGIAVDADDNAYIIGQTLSPDFPTVNAYDDDFDGVSDAFVAKLSPSIGGINSLLYSSYLGGTGGERGNSIAVDSNSNVYITGFTGSSDFPVVNPYDESHNGNKDVFVAKFGPVEQDIPTLSEWGMLIMALLLLAAGTIAIIRKRKTVSVNK